MGERTWPEAGAIVKVGGSLFDLPRLPERIRQVLGALGRRRIVVVAGGGKAARVIRRWDQIHRLGEEVAHWLALGAVTLSAQALHMMMPDLGPPVGTALTFRAAWRRRAVCLLDGYRFARADEGAPGALPHSWAATSDSLAARAAVVFRAPLVVLLKSRITPGGRGIQAAVRAGIVDPYFLTALAKAKPTPAVRLINLRKPRGIASLGRLLPTLPLARHR